MKRQKRRKRYQLKQRLRELDSIAKNQIYRNYNLFMASWGGTRCPGCGIDIRPYQLLGADFSGTLVDEYGNWTGHISGYLLPCKKVKKCPGERNWFCQ
jgi:hypothetical protein